MLGRGNFSEINLLRHRETKELRALKFCCKLDGPSYTHLRAEAMLAARVSGHPFVLSPLAVSDSPGRAGNYSVLLPLCPGGDLLQLLRHQPHHALSEPDARTYAGMIAHGLLALHAAGLAYRDLKPENLLIRENGYLRIADFGFTAPLAECRKQRIGTPMYQAPELMRKQPHGVAVDWWALGCLLLEMVTGHSPFLRDDEAETEAACWRGRRPRRSRCRQQRQTTSTQHPLGPQGRVRRVRRRARTAGKVRRRHRPRQRRPRRRRRRRRRPRSRPCACSSSTPHRASGWAGTG